MKPALIDSHPYYARCAGVERRGSRAECIAWADHQVQEWARLGYRRSAIVYYRDGSEVATYRSGGAQ